MRLRGERDLLSVPTSAGDARSSSGAPTVALLALVAAAVLWGTTGTAQALLPASADPLRPIVVGLARLALGGTALAAIALVGDPRRWRALARPGAALPAAIGALAVLAYHAAFFTGVARLGVALGTVVTLGVAPLIAGLGVAVLDRRRPTRAWLVATLVAVGGVGLLLLPAAGIRPAGSGIAAALAAGLAYATYALASKRLLDVGVERGVAMAALFGGGGAVALVALAPAAPRALLVEVLAAPRGAAIVLWLGLASVAVSYRLYARGLAELVADRATTLTLAEPLTAATLGILIVGERPTVSALLGGAAIVAGLVLGALSAGARSRSATRPSPSHATDRPSGGA